MLNDPSGLTRLLSFGVSAPKSSSEILTAVEEAREYRDYSFDREYSEVFDEAGTRSIGARSFADFDALLTTGNFEVAVVFGPEYMDDDARKRLDEIMPKVAALVKGFVVVTDLDQDVFPKESGQYGYVVQYFTPDDHNVSTIHEAVIRGLAAPDNRPKTNPVSPWEESTRIFTISFDEWPPEVATACEQYLLYFRNFLADIGIKSTTNLAHEAGNVLFSVLPDDPEEALDAIHDALELYLRLPTITEGTSVAPTDDISAWRLQAQVEHLKSQLTLAAATMRQQQVTIETQEIAIRLLKEVNAATDILLGAANSSNAKTTTSEISLFKGLVKVGAISFFNGAVKFDCAEAIRMGAAHWTKHKTEKQLRDEIKDKQERLISQEPDQR